MLKSQLLLRLPKLGFESLRALFIKRPVLYLWISRSCSENIRYVSNSTFKFMMVFFLSQAPHSHYLLSILWTVLRRNGIPMRTNSSILTLQMTMLHNLKVCAYTYYTNLMCNNSYESEISQIITDYYLLLWKINRLAL